jgi:hypothetical protein
MKLALDVDQCQIHDLAAEVVWTLSAMLGAPYPVFTVAVVLEWRDGLHLFSDLLRRGMSRGSGMVI